MPAEGFRDALEHADNDAVSAAAELDRFDFVGHGGAPMPPTCTPGHRRSVHGALLDHTRGGGWSLVFRPFVRGRRYRGGPSIQGVDLLDDVGGLNVAQSALSRVRTALRFLGQRDFRLPGDGRTVDRRYLQHQTFLGHLAV